MVVLYIARNLALLLAVCVCGAPSRPTSRTYHDMDKKLVEDLIEAARERERLD